MSEEPTILCLLQQRMFDWQAQNGQRLTFESLAERTGIADKTLRRWHNNDVTSFSVDVLSKLCAFFHVGVGDLLVYAKKEG